MVRIILAGVFALAVQAAAAQVPADLLGAEGQPDAQVAPAGG